MKHESTTTPSRQQPSTVFISACSGIMMRNFVIIPNGVIDQLKKEFERIVLIVPEEAQAQTQRDIGSDTVFVEGVSVAYKNSSPLLVLFEFIARHLSFTDGARMFAWYGVRIDAPVAGGNRLLYPLRILVAETFGKITTFKERVFPALEKKLFKNRPYKDVFDRHTPQIVFSTNVQHFLDRELIREAQRQGIRTIGMPGSWDHFPKQYTPTHVDRLLVWNAPQREEAIELQGYKEGDVEVVGTPYFDLFTRPDILMSRESFCTQFGMDPKKKIILFVSAAIYAPDDADIVEEIISAMERGLFSEPVQLLIRPYPGFVEEEKKRFGRFEGHEGVAIDWRPANATFADRWCPGIEDLKEHINVLFHADIVVNTYSSVSLEASIFAKPVIMIGYDGHHNRPYAQSLKRFLRLGHYQNVFKTGGVVLVESEEELTVSINKFLKDPASNQENIEKLKEKMCGIVDGATASRIVHAIQDQASSI